MKYVDEYRDRDLALRLADQIKRDADPARAYRFMEFCGGHTHAIARYGIEDLLPDNIRMIHGPGCPVCVLPVGRIDMAIELVRNHDVVLCTYGDVMRVPGSKRRSLLKLRAEGGDVRMVYSTLDALTVARDNPDRQVVFLAIGFETTTPPTALAIEQAAAENLANFSVFCNHVLTPPAIGAILGAPETEAAETAEIDGFVGPAHVSTVIGSAPYEPFAETYRKPVVIAGFEPLDMMQAIHMLVRQINEGRFEVENQYRRAVTRTGNQLAQDLTGRLFELRSAFEWRGLGSLPHSALAIREEFAQFDAERRFAMTPRVAPDNPACDCGEILRGVKRPEDCKLFGKVCTPDNPMGSCMVSAEGACAAQWTYGRFRAGRAA